MLGRIGIRGTLAVLLRLAATALTLFVLLAAAAHARPNVVVVMVDDMPKAQLRALPYTRTVLGEEGVTFENHSAAWPLCCPNRASFLTGQYPHNHGVEGNDPPAGGWAVFRQRESSTLATWLRRAGYYTGMVGKYLNGYGPKQAEHVPAGWNEWAALLNYDYNRPAFSVNGDIRRPRAYSTDLLATAAQSFIERRAPLRPFFLQVAPTAPHVVPRAAGLPDPPPAPRHAGAFANEIAPRLPNFNEEDVSDKPGYIRSLPLLTSAQIDQIDLRWRSMMESLLAVDELMSGIVGALRETGELDDTLIVFTSDNGYFHGEHRQPHGKNFIYRPSYELPLLMRGPGLPPGVVREQLVSTVDLPRTILDYAGVAPGRTQDGVSLIGPALDPSVWDNRTVLIEAKGATGLRQGRWLYTRWRKTSAEELYDLVEDPYQLNNLASDLAHATKLTELRIEHTRMADCGGASCRR